MEPATKKLKTEIPKDLDPQAQVSDGRMDPFHADRKLLNDLIMQHLSGAELITATEVSPDWRSIVEESKAFLSKVKLKIDGRKSRFTKRKCKQNAQTAELKALLGSHRKYVNAEIQLKNLYEIKL